MGNTTPNSSRSNSSSAPPSPSRWGMNRQNSASKQIHISTNHADGFYFTGERLTGTVKIPITLVHQHVNNINNQAPTELLYKRSLRSAIVAELIGDATYSSEVDAAADSDGHSTHQVNICRQRCIVTIVHDKNETETAASASSPAIDSKSLPITPAIVINGTFQLQIPDGLPPSLSINRTPSVIYILELSLSPSRNRYQIPITLSSRGSIPHVLPDIELTNNATNQHDINLSTSVPRSIYRPGEQIPVRVNFSNPQLRSVRSITVTLLQFYRIHNDQNRLQLDGKEWTFDILTTAPQREWTGEAHLQLPGQPLQASYSASSVGTTQTIEYELDYRILVELNEKKGDDIHLTMPSIHITYQT